VPDGCLNIDFEKMGEIDKVLIATEFHKLDHEHVGDIIPVTFKAHKDKVEY